MPVAKKTRGKSTRYYVITRSDGKKVSHGGFDSRRQAEAALSKVKVDKATGSYVPPSADTVDAFLSAWLASHKRLRPRTREHYRATIAHHISPVLGAMKVSAVRVEHVQTVVDTAERAGLKAPSVMGVHRILRAGLAHAVRTGKIAVNPADVGRGVQLPDPNSDKLQPPSPQEVTKILAVAEGHSMHLPLAIAAYSGLRRGEVCGLRWRDVDLNSGFVHVRQAATFTDATVTFDRPKSGDSARTVPIPQVLIRLLRAGKKEQSARRLKLGIGWRDLDLVVDSGDGSPLHPRSLTAYFIRLRSVHGIQVRLHDLRHAAVTTQLAAGVPLAIVSAAAGHASTSFTASRYGHLQPEHLRAAADAIEAAYGGESG